MRGIHKRIRTCVRVRPSACGMCLLAPHERALCLCEHNFRNCHKLESPSLRLLHINTSTGMPTLTLKTNLNFVRQINWFVRRNSIAIHTRSGCVRTVHVHCAHTFTHLLHARTVLVCVKTQNYRLSKCGCFVGDFCREFRKDYLTGNSNKVFLICLCIILKKEEIKPQ